MAAHPPSFYLKLAGLALVGGSMALTANADKILPLFEGKPITPSSLISVVAIIGITAHTAYAYALDPHHHGPTAVETLTAVAAIGEVLDTKSQLPPKE